MPSDLGDRILTLGFAPPSPALSYQRKCLISSFEDLLIHSFFRAEVRGKLIPMLTLALLKMS